VIQFTGFEIHARLEVAAGTEPALARRLLEKAEASCLVSRSLKAQTHLSADVKVSLETLQPAV
jgi:organic hydroperoxide reductase OsmC/OhrA